MEHTLAAAGDNHALVGIATPPDVMAITATPEPGRLRFRTITAYRPRSAVSGRRDSVRRDSGSAPLLLGWMRPGRSASAKKPRRETNSESQ
jgi:hypothetical protein